MTRQFRKICMLVAAGLLLLPVTGWSQQGDARRGEALYIGTLAFATGGAPCLACHGIAGHELGYAAGANYGPDLTALYEDFGEDGVISILEDPAVFESMTAIFAGRPLNDGEIADLTVFFAMIANKPQVDMGFGMAGHALLATVLIFVLFGALGWRRLQGVRRPLVERTRSGKGESA